MHYVHIFEFLDIERVQNPDVVCNAILEELGEHLPMPISDAGQVTLSSRHPFWVLKIMYIVDLVQGELNKCHTMKELGFMDATIPLDDGISSNTSSYMFMVQIRL